SRHTRFSRDWSSDVCSSDLSLTMLLLGLRLMLDLRASRSVFLCAQVVQDSAGRKDQPIGGRRSPYPARVIVPPCRVAPTDSTICELTPTRGHGCAQEGYPLPCSYETGGKHGTHHTRLTARWAGAVAGAGARRRSAGRCRAVRSGHLVPAGGPSRPPGGDREGEPDSAERRQARSQGSGFPL